MLVLNNPLHLWKESLEDHNLAYKTGTMKLINLEEIRILQDVIIFRTGIGQCRQVRGTWLLLLKDWKGKENLD